MILNVLINKIVLFLFEVKLHKRLVHIESKGIKCEWNGCEKMLKNALNMKNHVFIRKSETLSANDLNVDINTIIAKH